eukprot:CAMPEP_0174704790 /NCGR_PEP_ID=MMETSP1094-20130205/8242_1 /TAXON_ID=156173 /ORGANISM="Chrysochromulina brevifilum, Strain UTEX LB 985" /LENGTH=238 /DNA_ID=CAMNT_0015902877 /DNA_START=64 /DNA_END=780 /DNA_ORIENTATION=+
MMMTQLKMNWREVEHPSGKYWYHVRTKETTRDMPLATPPSLAIASLIGHDGGVNFEHCHHCHSTVTADTRYKALDQATWMKRRCCPLCEGLLDYTTVGAALSSTHTRPDSSSESNKVGALIARQESFVRRLARKAVPSFLGDAKEANVQKAQPVKSSTQVEQAKPATEAKPATGEEALTSSTRSKRISIKRLRLDNASATEQKSPRLEADTVRMVIGTAVNGVTSGQTVRFMLESEIA